MVIIFPFFAAQEVSQPTSFVPPPLDPPMVVAKVPGRRRAVTALAETHGFQLPTVVTGQRAPRGHGPLKHTLGVDFVPRRAPCHQRTSQRGGVQQISQIWIWSLSSRTVVLVGRIVQ